MDNFNFFASEDVTIVRSEYTGQQDRGGNDVPTITNIPSTAIVHVGQALNATSLVSETNILGTVFDSQITLIFPEKTVIKEGDQFKVRSTLWEIDGEPFDFYPEITNRFIPQPVIVKIKQRKGNV
jgi:hypothetical protein